MTTKKITLSELKSLVKQIIKEEVGRDAFYKGNKTNVKIIKCNNPMYWYKDFVGETFSVVPDDSNTKWADGKEKWKVVPDNRINGVNYINKEDTQQAN